MGQMTCPVLLAFVGLHVALVLCGVGLGTSRWLEGSHEYNTTGVNATTEHSEAKVGLWKVCVNDTCTSTAEGKQPAWYKACRITEVTAVAAIIVTLAFLYGFLLCASCKDSFVVIALTTVCSLGAAGTAITAVALFAVRTRDGFAPFVPKEYDLELGWTFYVATVGAAVVTVSAICNSRALCLVRSHRRPYENI